MGPFCGGSRALFLISDTVVSTTRARPPRELTQTPRKRPSPCMALPLPSRTPLGQARNIEADVDAIRKASQAILAKERASGSWDRRVDGG